MMDTELVPETTGREKFDRGLYILVALTAVSASLIGLLEAHSGAREERAFALSSRLSVDIFGQIAGSSATRSFRLNALQDVNATALEGLARGSAALNEPDYAAAGFALAEADQRSAERLPRIIENMSDPAKSGAEMDAATAEIATASLAEIGDVLAEQRAQVDLAERYGGRQDRAVFALSVVALAAVLLGLAGVLGANQVGRAVMATGATILLLSIGLAVSALRI